MSGGVFHRILLAKLAAAARFEQSPTTGGGAQPFPYNYLRGKVRLGAWANLGAITQANVYYVNGTAGSDSNDGRTSTAKTRSLDKAADSWVADGRPNDTCFALSGTLEEYVHDGSGGSSNLDDVTGVFAYNATQFTTDAVAGGENVIRTDPEYTTQTGMQAAFDGAGIPFLYEKNGNVPTDTPQDPSLLTISGDYWRVWDVEFRNSAGRGLNFGRALGNQGSFVANNIDIRNVYVHHVHGDGIGTSGTSSSNYGRFYTARNILGHHGFSLRNGGSSSSFMKLAYTQGTIVDDVVTFKWSDDGIDFFGCIDHVVRNVHTWLNGWDWTTLEPSTSWSAFGTADRLTAPTGDGNGIKCGGGSQSRDGNFAFCSSWGNRRVGVTHNNLIHGSLMNISTVLNGGPGVAYRDGQGAIKHVAYGNNPDGSNDVLIDNTNGTKDWPRHRYNSWSNSVGGPFSSDNYGITIRDTDFVSAMTDNLGWLIPTTGGRIGSLQVPVAVFFDDPDGNAYDFNAQAGYLGAFAPE